MLALLKRTVFIFCTAIFFWPWAYSQGKIIYKNYIIQWKNSPNVMILDSLGVKKVEDFKSLGRSFSIVQADPSKVGSLSSHLSVSLLFWCRRNRKR